VKFPGKVVITPDLGELDRKVTTVRELLAAADRQQQEARNSYRALAADLRAAGLSVSDTDRRLVDADREVALVIHGRQ
jgi:hypothetical protein